MQHRNLAQPRTIVPTYAIAGFTIKESERTLLPRPVNENWWLDEIPAPRLDAKMEQALRRIAEKFAQGDTWHEPPDNSGPAGLRPLLKGTHPLIIATFQLRYEDDDEHESSRLRRRYQLIPTARARRLLPADAGGRVKRFWSYGSLDLGYRDRVALPEAVRSFVLRMREPNTCRNPTCPRPAGDGRWEVDHVKAFTRGGTDELDNLQVLCRRCNLSKCAREWDEFSTVDRRRAA